MGIREVDKRSLDRLVELAVERGESREAFLARLHSSGFAQLDPVLLFAWYREMPELADHSDLLLAVMLRYDDLAEQLLASGADPNLRTHTGYTALIYASGQHNLRLARALVTSGADLDLRVEEDGFAEDGSTALLMALQVRNVEIAKLLLAAGAEPEIADTDGYTPLMAAADQGNAELVRLLLARGANPQARDQRGLSTLIAAAAGGSVEIGQLLIDRGVTVVDHSSSDGGWSPLHAASNCRCHDFMRWLIQLGANVNAKTSDGKTAVMLAINEEYQYPLGGDLEGVEILLNAGADPNITDESGDTALIYAAQRPLRSCKPDIAAALLKCGADTNIVNKQGHTALAIAIESSNDGVASVLRNAGAKE